MVIVAFSPTCCPRKSQNQYWWVETKTLVRVWRLMWDDGWRGERWPSWDITASITPTTREVWNMQDHVSVVEWLFYVHEYITKPWTSLHRWVSGYDSHPECKSPGFDPHWGAELFGPLDNCAIITTEGSIHDTHYAKLWIPLHFVTKPLKLKLQI